MDAIEVFRSMIERVPVGLNSISADEAKCSGGNGAWNLAQELGHLLDSAMINHTRVMRVLTEDNPALPGYDGDFYVGAHGYATRDWHKLISIWEELNRHFLMAVERVSEEEWKRPCVFDGQSVTLEFLFADYVKHALHHLQHIGIEVETFASGLHAQA